MAHFAQLDENNVVTRVIVVSNEDTSNTYNEEAEEIGVAFCKQILGADTNWKQTSYNNNIRVRYAGPGYSYNEELDAFIPPKPFASWVLNEETVDWQSPVGPEPQISENDIENGISHYGWDEELGNWIPYWCNEMPLSELQIILDNAERLRPYPSWTLNKDNKADLHWESPVGPAPEIVDGGPSRYEWSEELGNWKPIYS